MVGIVVETCFSAQLLTTSKSSPRHRNQFTNNATQPFHNQSPEALKLLSLPLSSACVSGDHGAKLRHPESRDSIAVAFVHLVGMDMTTNINMET